MSRCFPFPPPGYESKARPDDVSLIIKEKKQKKHKHKKEKDKKERSERKEKERSEGKHKEDKKRKRKKHRDKKDKKKDKQSSSEEKQVVGSLENQNCEKLVRDNKPTDGIQDKTTFSELGKRVRNDGGAMDKQMVPKITLVQKTKADVPGKVQDNSNGILPKAYDSIKDKREHSRMANGQSLKVNARSLGNCLVGNYHGENQIKVEGGSCQVDKVEKRKEGERNGYKNNVGEGDVHKNEDRNKNKKAEDKTRKDEKKKEMVTGGSKEKIKQGAIGSNFLDFLANNVTSDPVKERRDCQGKLLKHKELNGFLHDNGIRPDNMSRPAFSSHQAGQNGSVHASQNIRNLAVEKVAVIANQKVNGKLSSPQLMIINVRNMEPSQTADNSTKEHGRVIVNNHVLSNGFISSPRADIERKMEPCRTTNGVAKVKQIVKNCSADEKISSASPLLENGRKMAMQGPDAVHRFGVNNHMLSNGLKSSPCMDIERKKEPCGTTNGVAKVNLIVNSCSADEKIPSASPLLENGQKMAVQAPDAVHKMDTKEFKSNSSLEVEKQTSSRPSSVSMKAKEKVVLSTKPPHPDLKYLSQILTVPQVEWPECDDQEWLFGCRESQTKRPKLASSQIQSMKQVWAEAIRVESADVTAMPYVIPY